MKQFKDSELIVNPDGSIYHIKLRPEHIAPTVIVVGDQHRVENISRYFEKVEYRIQNREFLTHTGYFNGKRITVLSTGIGTDNIDIVINELDAAVNIDLEKRVLKSTHTSLDIIRLGTSGALQEEIPVDSFVVSEYGLGLEGLLNFYNYNDNLVEKALTQAFIDQTGWNSKLPFPYIVKGSESLIDRIGFDLRKGITATAPGFYAPQGRQLRIPPAFPELNQRIEQFNYNGNCITNFEMETSALYALGRILGHNTLTVCNIIANRVSREFSKDYKKSTDQLIQLVLGRVSSKS